MALTLTSRALLKSQEQSLEINVVFEIDGVETVFGAVPVRKFVRIGDPDLIIGDVEIDDDAFYVGSFSLIENQKTIISQRGTTQTIKQQLQQDKGEGSGISTFTVSLQDKSQFVTNLIAPDLSVSPAFDLLGRKCSVSFGFSGIAFPDDYIKIFRGVISEILPGPTDVKFLLSHPDNKKRGTGFPLVSDELVGAIDDSTTTIVLDDASKLLFPVVGPSGGIDADYESFLLIDSELIKYTGVAGNTLTGVVRGATGPQGVTVAASHDDEQEVKSVSRIKGNAMDLALKLMLSGIGDNWTEDQELEAFNVFDSETVIPNILFFKDTNVVDKYGLTVGDFISTSGSGFGSNNVVLKPIVGIFTTTFGDQVTIGGVSFVDEPLSDAVVSFRSQFDVWPSGLKMHGDEVDVDEFQRLKALFLSSFEYDFFLKDTIENGKDFLEKEVFSPSASYSLPRKARSSVGFHSGPIPGQGIKTLNASNIKDPGNIRLRRSMNRNFFNEILYSFEEDLLADRFLGGVLTDSQTSKARIANAPAKTLIIKSKGMRKSLSAKNNAILSSNRKLDRYEFGAESVPLGVKLSDALVIEIGDVVLLDGEEIKLADSVTGNRDFIPRLMETQNKTWNIWTGKIDFNLVSTSFDGAGRYCLIGVASRIKNGASTTVFTIEAAFNTDRFGQNEFQKWVGFKLPKVKVRNADFSNDSDSIIVAIDGNQITVSPALSFVPGAGDTIEFQDYDDSQETTEEIKLVYGHMRDSAFLDGKAQYIML